MAYTNYLLFNNIFLKNLSPTDEEMAAARHLVHGSAREWFRDADLSSTATMVDTWVKPLLNLQSLDLVPAELEEDNAWYIVAPWTREDRLALCCVAPQGTDLNGYAADRTLPKGQHWMIRAVNKALRCDMQNLRWVVLTNGEQWRLLDVHSLRRYEAFLEIDLYHLLSGEDDQMAAYLFYRLLRLEDSLERDDESGKSKLDALLEQSTKATEATERYLKTCVSDRLETPGGADGIMAQLCMGLVHAIDPQRTRSFTEQERDAIYRDATYLLYRLLFILYAEARNLLPVDRPGYQAVSLESLINEAVELRRSPQKAAGHPTSLWAQIITLFNAIQYSDEYLGIPAYNGGLFEDKDKPYLRDYAVENKFLAEALCELAFLPDPKGERPPERIDYRDLSVRHLGSLYEGMIEYKLFIASEKLYARRDKAGQVRYLSAAKTDLGPTDEVISPGEVYFAQSPRERKATGTHYTAEELVERLVRHTVVRLLDERWAAFKPQLEEWLSEIEATPTEADQVRLRNYVDGQIEAFVREQVLSLRICDPAMGSGHFLVHIAHRLTSLVLKILSCTHWDNAATNLDANYWRRLVVEHCLYGVDINGMAVELAKLSLWLATMQPGRPLSFLDHHLKCGNSLLGARLDDIRAVLADSDLSTQTRASKIAEAKGQYSFREIPQVMQKLERANLLLDKIASQVVDRAEDIAQQEGNYEKAQEVLQPYKDIGDLLVARSMGLKIADHDLRSIADAIEAGQQERLAQEQENLVDSVRLVLDGHKTHHWEMEYPDVFLESPSSASPRDTGFNVVIGNPPFLGGTKLSGELGSNFLRFVCTAFAPAGGNADLCAYFFRRGFDILRKGGLLGMVATNTIGQGATRRSGLGQIVLGGGTIVYADRHISWPGDATVEVNLVGILRPRPGRESSLESPVVLLDGMSVSSISPWLDDLPNVTSRQLRQNDNLAFRGPSTRGRGFIISPEEAADLLRLDSANRACLSLYLTGQDINGTPDQSPSRWAIDFGDRSYEEACLCPALLEIVEERVKPDRLRLRGDVAAYQRMKDFWWQHQESAITLRDAIRSLDRVIARSRVSELHMLAFCSTDWFFGDATVVFAFDDHYHFAVLQSSVHEVWLRRHSSSLRTDVRYTPTECFHTFPFPQSSTVTSPNVALEHGRRYYEHRQQYLMANQIGLTKTYNLFHDQACSDPDIAQMRLLHARMDQAVLTCYGWADIALQHGFYPNDREKTRYMPSPKAQREIFTRLLALNQEIAEQEAAQALPPSTETDET